MADREKLIELMCEAKKADTEDAPFSEFLADLLIANGVRLENSQAIKQVTSDSEKWISVEERLPPAEGLYLVAVKNDHNRRYSKTAWFHANGGWFSKQSVTHWMPLPEPPREV